MPEFKNIRSEGMLPVKIPESASTPVKFFVCLVDEGQFQVLRAEGNSGWWKTQKTAFEFAQAAHETGVRFNTISVFKIDTHGRELIQWSPLQLVELHDCADPDYGSW